MTPVVDGRVGRLAHVLVLSDDLERSRVFYERALGLSVGARPPLGFDGYWLYCDGECCLHLADRGSYRRHSEALGLPVPARVDGPGPVDHIAFSAGDGAAIDRRLREAGLDVVENRAPGGPRQLFVDDPDGQRVEISIAVGEN